MLKMDVHSPQLYVSPQLKCRSAIPEEEAKEPMYIVTEPTHNHIFFVWTHPCVHILFIPAHIKNIINPPTSNAGNFFENLVHVSLIFLQPAHACSR